MKPRCEPRPKEAPSHLLRHQCLNLNLNRSRSHSRNTTSPISTPSRHSNKPILKPTRNRSTCGPTISRTILALGTLLPFFKDRSRSQRMEARFTHHSYLLSQAPSNDRNLLPQSSPRRSSRTLAVSRAMRPD